MNGLARPWIEWPRSSRPRAAGGTAPRGATCHLNALFTGVFAAQLWATLGPGESGGKHDPSHEYAG